MAEDYVNDFDTTLDGSITDSATSLVVIDSPPTALTPNFRIRIEDEILLVTAIGGTGNKTWTVTREAEEATRFPKAAHSSGVVVAHVLTAGSLDTIITETVGFIDFALIKVTSGNKTLTSTTWANLDTGMDLTVTAATGDLIEASLSGLWGEEAQFGFIDVQTLVSGAGVNWFGSGEPTTGTGDGIPSWVHSNDAAYEGIGSPCAYVVQAGDISGGTVTLRLRYRVGGSLVLRAQTNDPLTFYCKVFRP